MQLTVYGWNRRVYTYTYLKYDISASHEDEPVLRFNETDNGDVEIELHEKKHLTLNGNFSLSLKLTLSELAALTHVASLTGAKRDRTIRRIRAPLNEEEMRRERRRARSRR